MNYSALIGKPTDHSVSYLLYDRLAKAINLPDFYQHIRLNVDAKDLQGSINALNALRFVGLNVTLPYKLDVIKYLDNTDEVVKELGAVNTIKLGGKTIGYNTDWMGIAESVRQFGTPKIYTSALIFGTGGASRAAIYACKKLGISEIHVFYRVSKSEKTISMINESDTLGVTMHPYSELQAFLKATPQLVINTTSAGMIGKEDLPIDISLLKDVELQKITFLDAVFNPINTPLLKHFRAEGAPTIDGLWMMVYQAVGAMGIWFDREINVTPEKLQDIHDLLEKEIGNV